MKGFGKDLMTGVILIDLQKTFDAIDHDALLEKFRDIGFSNHAIGWFKSHLSNGLFRVNSENFDQVFPILHAGYDKGPF